MSCLIHLHCQVSTEHGKVHVQDIVAAAKDDGDTDQGRLSTSRGLYGPASPKVSLSFVAQIDGYGGQWMPRAGVGFAARRDELPGGEDGLWGPRGTWPCLRNLIWVSSVGCGLWGFWLCLERGTVAFTSPKSPRLGISRGQQLARCASVVLLQSMIP